MSTTPAPRARLMEEPKKTDAKSEVSSKARFIRGLLEKNANISTNEIVEKWKEAGYPVDKSPNSGDVYQVKVRIRKKSSISSRARLTADGTTKKDDRHELAWYLKVEEALEDMILEAKGSRDKDMLEWMRKARRRASLKILQLQGEA